MFRRMTRERYLSDAELESFMARVRDRRHVNRDRDHAFFALVANTGLRPAEVMAIKRGDLKLEGRKPTLRLRLRRTPSSGPRPVVSLVLNSRVRDVVARYAGQMDPTDALFTFTKRQSARLFHYYAGKAGLAASYRIYCLRHTAGMRLWRHTRDLRLIQAVMGHRRLKATTAYVHVDDGTIRDAQEGAGTIT